MKQRLLYSIILVVITSGVLKSQDDWSVYLGEKKWVNISHIPDNNYIPDGHISVLPDGNGNYMMYWSEYRNTRTIGSSQFPQSHNTIEPEGSVFGGREPGDGESNGVNDGGAWLMSVHRFSGDTLIGFYHGESHWYPRNGNYTAWKSICVAYSYDNGFTWADSGQIVTSDKPKPEQRAWGGAGDCCVVWDSLNQRWNCYFQEHNIRIAVSYDPLGAPGTWKKLYNGSFDEEGLGGFSTPLSNLSNYGGANPSVHYNTFLDRWFMTYHGWNGGIYVTASNDGINWDTPRLVISKGDYNNWYPTIIGVTDTEAGREAKLYYGEFVNSNGYRYMYERDILFDTLEFDYGYIPLPWKGMNIGSYTYAGKAGKKNDLITITGATNNLTSNKDQFYFYYQETKDSLEISTKIESQTSIDSTTNSGLMIRTSTESNAPFISVSKQSGTDTIQIIRRDIAGEVPVVESFVTVNSWLKLQKNAENIEIFYSADGQNWELLSTYNMSLTDKSVAGLFATSHQNNTMGTAIFSNTNLTLLNMVNNIYNNEVAAENFKIFPNPVQDYLHIVASQHYGYLEYTISAMSGKIVHRESSNKKSIVINTSSIQNNQYYILQVRTESNLLFSKQILKNSNN